MYFLRVHPLLRKVIIPVIAILALFYVLTDREDPIRAVQSLGISVLHVAVNNPQGDQYKLVTRVVDGDTVIIEGKKVRLIGIDTPELKQHPWGKRANNHLEAILNKTKWKVRTETDVVQIDKYGRLLAYLWTEDGKMVNLEMVNDGYALMYTVPPNVKYVNKFTEAQKYARENKKGFWAEGGLSETPGEYRKKNGR